MQKIWFWLIILLVITGFGLWFWYSKMMPSTKQPSASSDEITYIALGDSYTIGNGVQTEERWPNVLTAHLKSSGQNIRLIANPAVSGYKVSDALEKELPIVEQMKPDFVTVLIGANDNFGGKAPAFFQEELQEFLDQLQKTMKNPQQIVLITIPDYSKSPSASGYDTTGVTKSIQEYNRIIKSEAAKRDLKVADIFPLSQAMTDPIDFIHDGLHPSAKSYARWEKVIYPVVLEVLNKRTK